MVVVAALEVVKEASAASEAAIAARGNFCNVVVCISIAIRRISLNVANSRIIFNPHRCLDVFASNAKIAIYGAKNEQPSIEIQLSQHAEQNCAKQHQRKRDNNTFSRNGTCDHVQSGRKGRRKCRVSIAERESVLCRSSSRQGIFTSEYRGKRLMASSDTSWLSADARRVLRSPNAGGHSILSEALSVQYFVEAFGAHNVCIETEIAYWFTYKMADFLITVDTFSSAKFDYARGKTTFCGSRCAERIGVSVTRAMSFPSPSRFSVEDAILLLRKKLYGLIVARRSVCAEDSFETSCLHVLCQTHRIAGLVERAFYLLADEDDPRNEFALTTSIIVICTVVDDKSIFCNSKQLQAFCE